MAANTNDKASKVANGGIPASATVTATRATGVTTLAVDTQTYWPTDTGVKFQTYKVDTNNEFVPGSLTDWAGVSNGTNAINSILAVGGAGDVGNAIGDKVVMSPTAQWGEDFVEAFLQEHTNPLGKHGNITTTAITNNGNYNQSSGTFDVPTETIKYAAVGKGTDWAWTDYSATSTIVGWGSFTKKVIKYIQVGKTIQVFFALDGVSNAGSASFTLPVPAKNQGGVGVAVEGLCGFIQDSGATPTNPIDWRFFVDPASNASLLMLQKGFASSGTKSVRGSFFYEVS